MSFIPERDSDGVPLNRNKITKSGWHFQAHAVEFETSKLASDYNKDIDENDLGFTTIKFYNSSDVELTTQVDIDASCVKTVLDWEPDHDIDLIGGTLYQTTPPTSDVRLWIRAVPDVPKLYGGSIDFSEGGVNLRRLGSNILDLNGVTAKTLTADPVNHTTKFRFVVRHDAGIKCPVYILFKSFKSGTE